MESLRPKLRFRVAHQVGFACADLEDIAQETLARFLVAQREGEIRDTGGAGAYLNAICRNVTKITSLDSVLEIFEDETAAIRSFR